MGPVDAAVVGDLDVVQDNIASIGGMLFDVKNGSAGYDRMEKTIHAASGIG